MVDVTFTAASRPVRRAAIAMPGSMGGIRGLWCRMGLLAMLDRDTGYEFRYNNREALGCNDGDRSVNAMKGIAGKRLTYRRIDERAEA